MNLVFVGRFFPKKILSTISVDSRGSVGMSNHNFEMSIINGFCQQTNIQLHCLSIPGVYSYPRNNKRIYTKTESYYHQNARVYSVGFCNLPIVKEIWSTFALAYKLLRVIKNSKEDRVDVVINTPHHCLITALQIAKLLTRKRVTQTVILPDIPSLVTAMGKTNKVKTFILEHLDKQSMRQTSHSDGLVLLTEAMMDFFSRPIKHIVMEGIVDVKTMDQQVAKPVSNNYIILYTGTLRKIFGVMNLVLAFQMLKQENIELWICGSGECKDAIEEAALQDPRIKFFGLVNSQMALKFQHQATILVNPRTSEGEYTKYSFPSKTMEYLLAGKSVIANRLPGIPEEYYEYIYTPKDESVVAMAECINSVLAIDDNERNNKALSGREFVMNKKNSKTQTARIIEMIETY